VITTGSWSNRYAQTWRNLATSLKGQNFDVYSIGITQGVARPQLLDVASQSGYYFQYSDYDTSYQGYREVVQVIIFGRGEK